MNPVEGVVSIENVCDVEVIASPGAGEDPPCLLFEVPHGATLRRHYDAIRRLLSPGLPADLTDYFFVNTDVGSMEYARETAKQIVDPASSRALGDLLAPDAPRELSAAAARKVLILRCLIPRTFIDTNRVIDAALAYEREADLTAALPDYIRKKEDVETLVGLWRVYHEVADRAYHAVCGDGGFALMPHTYAPKSVIIESFDEGIGKALRAAYEPERYARWEARPRVDIISEGPDGARLAPERIVSSLRENYRRIGVEASENESYRLHPATMGHLYSARYPGRVLCMEIARDLLAEPFTPFEEMRIGAGKVERMSAPIAAAFLEELARAR